MIITVIVFIRYIHLNCLTFIHYGRYRRSHVHIDDISHNDVCGLFPEYHAVTLKVLLNIVHGRRCRYEPLFCISPQSMAAAALLYKLIAHIQQREYLLLTDSAVKEHCYPALLLHMVCRVYAFHGKK